MSVYPVIWNGELLDGERLLPAWNRAFHFGDGLFETMRVVDGTAPFLNYHLQRAARGMEAMGIERPERWEEGAILEDIGRLLEEWGDRHARLRITIFRSGAGAYTPQEDKGEYSIERTAACEKGFVLPEQGIELGTYEALRLHPDPFSSYKGCNARPYVMAKRWALQNGYDEALLKGPKGNFVEAASSNLFLRMGDELLTPPASDGCVNGVMRQVLLELLHERGTKITERSLTPKDAEEGDELFLSNAVNGIIPVARFQGGVYERRSSEELLSALNERVFS